MTCSEFFLGHKVDQHGYDKFFQDIEYVRKQYLVAENVLNIISNPPLSKPTQEQSQKLEAQDQQIRELRKKLDDYKSFAVSAKKEMLEMRRILDDLGKTNPEKVLEAVIREAHRQGPAFLKEIVSLLDAELGKRKKRHGKRKIKEET